MKEKILWGLFLSCLMLSVFPYVNAPFTTPKDIGLSGYITSISEAQNIINYCEIYNLTVYRISSNPSWYPQTRPYTQTTIQYILDNSNLSVIVDPNHLYPPTSSLNTTEWNLVNTSIFNVLATWENNSRVAIELLNEYTGTDLYSRMQTIITDVRDSAYNNTLIFNKWYSINWQTVTDPLNNTYQGAHIYFSEQSLQTAKNKMITAQSLDIPLINTEVGADVLEYPSFEQDEVDDLQDFLEWCYDNNIGNCVWQNNNLDNMPTYASLGFDWGFVEDAPIYPDPEEEDDEPPESIEDEPDYIEPVPITVSQAGTYLAGGNIRIEMLNGSSFGVSSDRAGVIVNVTSGNLNGTLTRIEVLRKKGAFYINTVENATFTIQGWNNTASTVVPSVSGTNGAERTTDTMITASCIAGNTVKIFWGTEIEPMLPIMFIFGMVGLASFVGGILYGAKLLKEGDYEEALINGCIFCSLGFGLILAWLMI